MRSTGRRAASTGAPPEVHLTLVWFALGLGLGALIGWFVTRDLVGLGLGLVTGWLLSTTVNLMRARRRGDLTHRRRRYQSPI